MHRHLFERIREHRAKAWADSAHAFRMKEGGQAMATTTERVRDVVLPLLTERQLDLYDIELAGPVLKVVVDRPAGESGGLDLDVLADATRAVSRALDEADPIAGHYTLEVTSPGLERPLRTPRHFVRAVGEAVNVKVTAAAAAETGERRVAGVLATADDEGITVRSDDPPAERRVSYADIERARTVFEWGPAEKPGKRSNRRPAATADGAPPTDATTEHEKKDHRS
jgi:ribosome maturation factor RimP